jgi:hypothetical protein
VTWSRCPRLWTPVPDDLPLESGGRDLDNYLRPVAQRIGANRIDAAFTTTMTGSYDSAAWRQ